MKKKILSGLTITTAMLCIAGAGNAASINISAMDTVSVGTSGQVWADNRLRAYDNSGGFDVYGFMLFDISGLDDGAKITSMTLKTYHEATFANPVGDPIVDLLYSSNDNWSRNTVSGFIGGVEATLSTGNSAFPSGINTPYSWNIDMAAHDWTRDLSDNFITLAMNQTAPGYRYVYWHGSDNQELAPTIEIEYSLTPVPEPTAMILFGTGLFGFAGAITRIKKK